MIIAIIAALLIITALYYSPVVKKLSKNKPMQHLYHILCVFLILAIPSPVFVILDVPLQTANLTGKYLFYFGLPLLIFVAIRKVKSSKKQDNIAKA
ncbi:hypothetical protein OLMES_1333 [Oleiphilus messinensis]|uniref:Uncharacterized protein n=1 Tax=Oleiphilus messinensis TaxID=141451 RepID=A0A1Y0I4S1_9GAMM|nr:hypothetical protein [Oleiphilus messinensis]ARU55411.1 hypothetical protein OLMES_1333 [Oleiphilus messinensis]